MQPTYRDVAFLLSLGTLPLACKDSDPADDDTSTGGGPPPTTDTPTSDLTTADDSDATESTTDDSATTTGTTGEAPSLCQQYSDHLVECLPYYDMYGEALVTYCETTIADGLASDGPACAAAIEAYFVCFNAVACADIEEEGETSQCEPAAANIKTNCPSFDDTTESSSDTIADSGNDEGNTTGATGSGTSSDSG